MIFFKGDIINNIDKIIFEISTKDYLKTAMDFFFSFNFY